MLESLISWPIWALLFAAPAVFAGVSQSEEENEVRGNGVVEFPRGSPAYVVASPQTGLEQRMAERLTDHLERVLGEPAQVVPSLDQVPERKPAIVLASEHTALPFPVEIPRKTDEDFALVTGQAEGRPVVVAAGQTDRGLKRAVQRLIIHSQQQPQALVLLPLNLSESPWIPHREWTICPWEPHFVRGTFHNPHADPRLNVYAYSPQRLADYVEMFDWVGFSGCQLMETCYTYAALGSIDAAQEWQKRVVGLLRDNGQEVSLWAWAAQFTGFGWADPDVTYTPQGGKAALEDPQVRATFEKYYDHYAELAPYVNRFIAHFFDPGQLAHHADVFQAMRLLEEKLRAKNPQILMGVDCWAATTDYLLEMVDHGFQDYLFLPVAFAGMYAPGQREEFHRKARELGLTLGIWGWYTTEYETDQIASMYVNAQLLKDFYQRMKRGALSIYPVGYWSEMEAHHLNNIYSLYAASQLYRFQLEMVSSGVQKSLLLRGRRQRPPHSKSIISN